MKSARNVCVNSGIVCVCCGCIFIFNIYKTRHDNYPRQISKKQQSLFVLGKGQSCSLAAAGEKPLHVEGRGGSFGDALQAVALVVVEGIVRRAACWGGRGGNGHLSSVCFLCFVYLLVFASVCLIRVETREL